MLLLLLLAGEKRETRETEVQETLQHCSMF